MFATVATHTPRNSRSTDGGSLDAVSEGPASDAAPASQSFTGLDAAGNGSVLTPFQPHCFPALFPPHAVAQPGDVRGVMTAMPCVKRQIEIQADQADFGVPERTLEIRAGE